MLLKIIMRMIAKTIAIKILKIFRIKIISLFSMGIGLNIKVIKSVARIIRKMFNTR